MVEIVYRFKKLLKKLLNISEAENVKSFCNGWMDGFKSGC